MSPARASKTPKSQGSAVRGFRRKRDATIEIAPGADQRPNALSMDPASVASQKLTNENAMPFENQQATNTGLPQDPASDNDTADIEVQEVTFCKMNDS